MMDDRLTRSGMLQSIADVLGVEPGDFYAERGAPHAAQDMLDLLSAFDAIIDPDDRRRCIDYIRGLAGRQGS